MASSIWSEVIGHSAVKEKLQLMVSKNRLPHCNLFAGPEGIGKKKVALALAQTMVCIQNSTEACGVCGSCVRVAQIQSEDLLLVSPEKQTIKLAQAKEVMDFLSLSHAGRNRFVIIDGADKLNPQAANALLKLIEEPPDGTFFILLAPSPQSVLPTIRSRSQWLRFQTLEVQQLQQIMPADDWMYQACQGSLQVLKTLTETEVSSKRLQYLETLEQMVNGKALNDDLFSIVSDKAEALFVAKVWGQAVHDALVLPVRPDLVIHKDQQGLIGRIAQVGESFLHRFADKLKNFEKDVHGNLDRSLCIENLKLQVAHGLD